MSLFGIIMDGVLMALLVAALAFGVRLDKRLKALKNGQEDFARAVGDLDAAAIKAHESLSALHGGADESQELLHGRILVARDLIQKLDQRIARAERLAIELESGRGLTRKDEIEIPEARSVARPPLQRPEPRSRSQSVVDDDEDSPETLELLRQAIRSNRLDIADDGPDSRVGQRLAWLHREGAEPVRRVTDQNDRRQMQRPELRTRRMVLERDEQMASNTTPARSPVTPPARTEEAQAMQERLRLTETVMESLNQALGSLAREEAAPAQPQNRRPVASGGTPRREDDIFDRPNNRPDPRRPGTRRTSPGDI